MSAFESLKWVSFGWCRLFEASFTFKNHHNPPYYFFWKREEKLLSFAVFCIYAPLVAVPHACFHPATPT